MTSEVKLLTQPTNYAVVQLPGRNYPGVVVQGDTLNSFVESLVNMQKLLAEGELVELSDEIGELLEQLVEARKRYEMVCAQQVVELPYARKP